MNKRVTDRLHRLDTIEACHAHIRRLQRRVDRLELIAEASPIRGDRPYKVLGYHRARMHSKDDGFGVYAEFQTLAEAVAYCRQQIDGQIVHAVAEAETGLLTTARDLDDAITELLLTGWCFWVSNVVDPAAREAFEFGAYARARLSAAVMAASGMIPENLKPQW